MVAKSSGEEADTKEWLDKHNRLAENKVTIELLRFHFIILYVN
jgi:hypothetical protein